MDEIDQDRRQGIEEALRDSDERWPTLLRGDGAERAWAAGIVDRLWLLSGSDGVAFLESTIEDDQAGRPTARIVALTTARAIVLRTTYGASGGERGRAYARRAIRSVALLEVDGAADTGEDFPAGVRMRLELEQGVEIEVGSTPVGRARLASVYGSLLHDLD